MYSVYYILINPVLLEVRLGEARVTQLEKALKACQSELQGYVSKIEADSAHHEDVVRAYKHQVCVYVCVNL